MNRGVAIHLTVIVKKGIHPQNFKVGVHGDFVVQGTVTRNGGDLCRQGVNLFLKSIRWDTQADQPHIRGLFAVDQTAGHQQISGLFSAEIELPQGGGLGTAPALRRVTKHRIFGGDGNVAGKLEVATGIGTAGMDLSDGDPRKVKDSGVLGINFFIQDIIGTSSFSFAFGGSKIILSFKSKPEQKLLPLAFKIRTLVLSSASA